MLIEQLTGGGKWFNWIITLQFVDGSSSPSCWLKDFCRLGFPLHALHSKLTPLITLSDEAQVEAARRTPSPTGPLAAFEPLAPANGPKKNSITCCGILAIAHNCTLQNSTTSERHQSAPTLTHFHTLESSTQTRSYSSKDGKTWRFTHNLQFNCADEYGSRPTRESSLVNYGARTKTTSRSNSMNSRPSWANSVSRRSPVVPHRN